MFGALELDIRAPNLVFFVLTVSFFCEFFLTNPDALKQIQNSER